MPFNIPKTIIHIFCSPDGGDANLPLFNQCALQNVRLLHPEFRHILFGRTEMENFLQKEFPEYRPVMNAFKYPIQRFDFFRYLAVFRLGGFYFDLDVFLARRLDELLVHQCVFPFEEITTNQFLRNARGMDWEIANYGFGSVPGHPFLKAVIDNCVRAQRDPQWVQPMLQSIPPWFRSDFHVVNTTGPALLSRTLAENPELATSVTVLFPPDVCNKRDWHQFGSFGVHAQQGSWRNRSSYLRRRLGNLWEAWRLQRGMNASRRLGKSRSVTNLHPR